MNRIRKQKGFSLTEALVAFVVVAIGLLSVATFQSSLFRQSAYNKARTEALALAQQKIEQLKHYTQAPQEAYIDEDGDGVMDADGTYNDDPIDGQNATFNRSWELASNNLGKEVGVTVTWADADGQNQSVLLAAEIPWLSPRTAADQIVDLNDPLVDSPTGRARMGDGNINDIPGGDLIKFPNVYADDGMSMYQYGEDLLLTNISGDVVLTLEDACSTETGQCTDFVRIAGTVYIDTANTRVTPVSLRVLASNAAYCQRWVPEGGTLDSPPLTANGDYSYYHYTCYLGGGWHGNIGFVKDGGLLQREKVCQGDPTSLNAWEQPVIALRRAYRGMLKQTNVDGSNRYYSHGIKDATRLIGQDFVFTELEVTATEGYHCGDIDAPMTRTDSYSGKLFSEVPTDFVCLNADDDEDSLPDYLDLYDTSKFTADTTCPFDPTSPPVLVHQVSGTIGFLSYEPPVLDELRVVTSDGPGNCRITGLKSGIDRHVASYVCNVYDWGSGWTGAVALREKSEWLYCPESYATFSQLTTDATQNFGCVSASSVVIEGSITSLVRGGTVDSMVIENVETGTFGVCEMVATAYRCVAPYEIGGQWSGTLIAYSGNHVCGSTEGAFTLTGLTSEFNPHTVNIVIVRSSSNCPVEAESL
jgi:type II secretory pathway pseudopilin PulG